jgi:hypothetical protein
MTSQEPPRGPLRQHAGTVQAGETPGDGWVGVLLDFAGQVIATLTPHPTRKAAQDHMSALAKSHHWGPPYRWEEHDPSTIKLVATPPDVPPKQ